MEFKPNSKLFRPWLNDQTDVNRYDTDASHVKLDKSMSSANHGSQHSFNLYLPFVSNHHIMHHNCVSSKIETNNSYANFVKLNTQLSPIISPKSYSSNTSSSIFSNDTKPFILSHRKLLTKLKRQRPKRFNCPHCQIAFSNNGQLKGHIRTHTGERPFVCDHSDCGKSFTRNEELTRHRRIHSGIRPYSCILCTKRFGRKDHLKKHQRTHEKRFFSIASNSLSIESVPNSDCVSLFNQMVFQIRH